VLPRLGFSQGIYLDFSAMAITLFEPCWLKRRQRAGSRERSPVIGRKDFGPIRL